MLSKHLRYMADSLWATAESGLDLSPRSQKEVAHLLHDYARSAQAIEQELRQEKPRSLEATLAATPCLPVGLDPRVVSIEQARRVRARAKGY